MVGISLMIDQTITWGNIIEIAVIAGGGIGVFTTMRTTVKYISDKVDGMQDEIKKLGDIITNQARADERHRALEQRVALIERRCDDFAHGDGFVTGNRRGTIDREYP